MERNSPKIPGVLILVTASLGVFFNLLVAGFMFWSSSKILGSENMLEAVTNIRKTATLSIGIGILNLPAFVLSIKRLKGIQFRRKTQSLFKSATWLFIAWIILMFLLQRHAKFQNYGGLRAALTFILIAIPIWWLVEFARKGIQRQDTLIEYGSLSLGLTFIPFVIIILEGLSILFIIFLFLLLCFYFQPKILTNIAEIIHLINNVSNSSGEWELVTFRLFQNRQIAFLLFLIVGAAAPLIEELLKPLSVWLLSNKPIRPRDGFVLGLIGGGAFALLESTVLVTQLSKQDWLIAILLRAATAWLHISMSGLVGYGIAKARSVNHWRIALRNLAIATGLHGLWNSIAIISDYRSIAYPTSMTTNTRLINFSFIAWLLPFMLIAATIITIRLRSHIIQEQESEKYLMPIGTLNS